MSKASAQASTWPTCGGGAFLTSFAINHSTVARRRMVRYAMSCTAPRAAASLPSGAETNTDCSAAGKAAPKRTAPTAWPAQSSAKPSDSGARCSIDKRDSRGRADGEAEREEGFGVMKEAKAGRTVRAAQSAHIVAWRRVRTSAGGL